jgi:MoxR-like ATPase
MKGRYHLSVEDVRQLAVSILRHRVILNFDAHADNKSADAILKTIIDGVTAQAPKA